MSDGAEGAAKGLGLFSTLESATDALFFLLAGTFILLVDATLVFFHQSGLIELIRKPELITQSLGLEIILIFIGFSFLTSIALRILAIPIDVLVIHTVGWTWITIDSYLEKKFPNQNGRRQRNFECVNPSELRKAAHERKDSYLLGLYEKYEAGWISNRKSMFKYATYAFYAFVMVVLNYFVVGGPERISLLREVSAYLGSPVPIWSILLALFGIAYSRFWRNDDPDWIYCPTLYAELQELDRKKIGQF